MEVLFMNILWGTVFGATFGITFGVTTAIVRHFINKKNKKN